MADSSLRRVSAFLPFASLLLSLLRRTPLAMCMPTQGGATKLREQGGTPSLKAKVEQVLQMLRERRPLQPQGLPAGAHELPPHLPKDLWEELGLLVRERERCPPLGVEGETGTIGTIPGSCWISLRLDGCGFSKQVKTLRRIGILQPGFCPTFGEIMQDCTKALMEAFHCCIGYTQSDEITVIIQSARVIRKEQQGHLYGGRVQKLCSVAASTVTALFNRRLSELASRATDAKNAELPLAYFDCRVGAFNTADEALSLLLWRMQDCGINGVSDAVHHSPGAGAQIRGANVGEKLGWLAQRGQLPLHPHQAYGSLFLFRYRKVQGCDPRTGDLTEACRRRLEQFGVGRCLLSLVAEGALRLDQDEDAELRPV